jgi:hypothetical protein
MRLVAGFWRRYSLGDTERKIRVLRAVYLIAAFIFVVVAATDISLVWSAVAIWFMGMATGFCTAVSASIRLDHQRWPLMKQIVDWSKVEQIAPRIDK